MRVMILGGDGYLGWPTAMAFRRAGHDVCAVDNYLRRKIARDTNSDALMANPLLPERAALFESVTGLKIEVAIGDCCDFEFLSRLVERFAPDVLVHYAEQPSAPYSMMGYDEARTTLSNNLNATFNTIWAVMRHAPDCHVIKLGTMGEYGTPNIDIEEGWIDIQHKGRSDKFLFPRQAGSLYHTTKVLDTDLLWFYVRIHGLRVTDLMQGPVYGLSSDEADLDARLKPNFHYDDIFGTVVNRFLVQAVAGIPLTVYGRGGQKRGYLNLRDTLQCIALAAAHPPGKGELRILNQFTETFSVNELAERVQRVGRSLNLKVDIQHLDNPRKEMEEHYYNPAHHGLAELGLKPHLMTDDVVAGMLEQVLRISRSHRARSHPAARAVAVSMRWLVTGGCGFIGRNFIRLLLTRSNDTIRVVDDLSVGTRAELEAISPVVALDPADARTCRGRRCGLPHRDRGRRRPRCRAGAPRRRRSRRGHPSRRQYRGRAVGRRADARLHHQRARHAQLSRSLPARRRAPFCFCLERRADRRLRAADSRGASHPSGVALRRQQARRRGLLLGL